VRAAWTLAALLVVVTPFAIRQPEEADWEEITPLEEIADATPEAASPLVASTPPGATAKASAVEPLRRADAAPAPPASAVPPSPMPPSPKVRLPRAPPGMPAWMPPLDGTAVEAPRAAEDPPAARMVKEPPPAPSAPAPPPGAAPATPGPLVVEYVNAFCTHCRATHRRLERVLERTQAPVRRRRVYTWGGTRVPLWARACVYASAQGKEDDLFRELMSARNDRPAEVYAAAARAGVDVAALEQALRDPTPPARLRRDQQVVRSARLRKLPTLDIGRRRLMGEQSEAELRTALLAATRRVRDMP
jgi:hypothetical protein